MIFGTPTMTGNYPVQLVGRRLGDAIAAVSCTAWPSTQALCNSPSSPHPCRPESRTKLQRHAGGQRRSHSVHLEHHFRQPARRTAIEHQYRRNYRHADRRRHLQLHGAGSGSEQPPATASAPLSITIDPAVPLSSPPPPCRTDCGPPYSAQLSAIGGVYPYTWSIPRQSAPRL